MFIEYPKSLYFDGDAEKAHVIVQNAEEEAEQRAHGFRMSGEPQQESAPVKRTRKAKS